MEENKTNKVIYKEIEDLFRAREKAVRENDKELLQTTQLNTRVFIPRYKDFSVEIITIANADTQELKKVAFVKETYKIKDYEEDTDEGYTVNKEEFHLYHLLNTALGWRIGIIRGW